MVSRVSINTGLGELYYGMTDSCIVLGVSWADSPCTWMVKIDLSHGHRSESVRAVMRKRLDKLHVISLQHQSRRVSSRGYRNGGVEPWSQTVLFVIVSIVRWHRPAGCCLHRHWLTAVSIVQWFWLNYLCY